MMMNSKPMNQPKTQLKMLDHDCQPDLIIKVWLVPHGYQVDVMQGQSVLVSTCRDYAGEVESTERHIGLILKELDMALASLRNGIK